MYNTYHLHIETWFEAHDWCNMIRANNEALDEYYEESNDPMMDALDRYYEGLYRKVGRI